MIMRRKWKNKWLTPFAVLTYIWIHIHRSSHVTINGNTFSCRRTIEVSKVSIHIYIYRIKHAFLLNSMENKETHAEIMKTSFFYYYPKVLHTYLSIYHFFTLSKLNRCWVRLKWCNFYSNGYLIHSYRHIHTSGTCHWLTMSGLRLHACIAAG
jgi:hypothetical protein